MIDFGKYTEEQTKEIFLEAFNYLRQDVQYEVMLTLANILDKREVLLQLQDSIEEDQASA